VRTMPIQILVTCKIQGNYYKKQQKVKLEPTDLVDTLYEQFSRLTAIPVDDIIVKYSKEQFTLRVIPGWTFEFYCVKNGDSMYVESAQQIIEEVDTAAQGVGSKERKYRELFMMKIDGKLDDIDTESKSSSNNPSVMVSHGHPTKQNPEALQKEIFNAIRKGDSEFSNFQARQQKLEPANFQTMGLDGWYPIHYAINYGNKTAIKYICNMSNDLNQTTKDGYTVLMLCAYKKSLEFFKMILETNKVDVNIVTSKGTIVHFLFDNDLKQFLPYLQQMPINPNITDSQGRVVRDVITDPNLSRVIIERYESTRNSASPQKKPLGAKGTVFKTGSFFRNLKARFLELNTNERCLIRYESRSDAPNKPIEIVSLKDVVSAKCVNDKYFLQAGLFYFEVVDAANCNLYATKSQQTALKWVQMINQAVDYCFHVEKLLAQAGHDQLGNNLDENHAEMIDFDLSGSFRAGASNIATGSAIKRSMVEEDSTVTSLKQSLPKPRAIEYKPRLFHFEVIKKLGQGNFGVVYKVKFTPNKKIYAMKVLPKKKVMTNQMWKYAEAEANILKKNNHPLVLSLYFSFQTPTNLYMVIDCCSDKTLESLITEKDKFSEEEARFYLAEIIVAIEYIHNIGVLYRDMKPENILIGLDGHIMLADFGLSKENVGKNELAKSFLGSPIYLAPEMVTGQGFTQSSDIYAIGIVFYEMLFGEDPYHTNDKVVLYERIKGMEVKMLEEVSPEAEDLLKRLLIKEPEKRIGARSKEEIKSHPFFKNMDFTQVWQKKCTPPFKDLEGSRRNNRNARRIDDQEYEEHNKGFLRVPNWSFVKQSELEQSDPTLLQAKDEPKIKED
jgi:serine/threonine protein kinase